MSICWQGYHSELKRENTKTSFPCVFINVMYFTLSVKNIHDRTVWIYNLEKISIPGKVYQLVDNTRHCFLWWLSTNAYCSQLIVHTSVKHGGQKEKTVTALEQWKFSFQILIPITEIPTEKQNQAILWRILWCVLSTNG